MTSQMVEIHTPGLKWWLSHLETDFNAEHSVDLYIKSPLLARLHSHPVTDFWIVP